MHLTRRRTLATLAALPLAGQAHAQTSRFAAAIDRARDLDQLHSISIAQNGETAVAERLRGPSLDTPANVKSVSKTIVALLTGIAIDKGELVGPDARLADVAPKLIPASADPRVAEITVENLLTMRTGLERTSGGNYGGWVSSRNWVSNALTRPFVDEPGGRMLYSTGSYHILGAALSEATGQSLLTLARRWLGEPLGIEIPAWTRDPQGRYMGGNEMALTPTAMLRIGEMARQGGIWNGTRVISEGWIEASLTPRTRSQFSGHDYGYGWFLTEADGETVAYARGYGGQMIYVLPDLALTVAITSDPTRPARSRGYAGELHRLLAEEIVPAART